MHTAQVTLGQVFRPNFSFPFQSSFYQYPHTHLSPNGSCSIGQTSQQVVTTSVLTWGFTYGPALTGSSG